MGNCNFKQEYETDNITAINKNHFQFHYVIGKGGFGKVWKVEKKKGKQMYAMKEMAKSRVYAKKSVNSVINERKLLANLKHPFLVNMAFAFQDRENLFLVMDLLTGGDLRYHISRNKKFTEEQTRFFIGCIVQGLDYVHKNSIIHRDIKPENLVFDNAGYLRITDFGIARLWSPENSSDTSGTPGYMAPEVMCRQNHGVAVDYFAVAVIAYECMFGRRPYQGRTRKEIRDHILSKQITIKRQDIPPGWSLHAADFINKMLQRKPVNRLGYNGPDEVKAHPWIKDFPWQDLMDKKIRAPFMPSSSEDNFDFRSTNDPWKDENTESMRQSTLLLRRNSIQALFGGYYYDNTMINSSSSTFISAKAMPSTMINSGAHPISGHRSNQISRKNSMSTIAVATTLVINNK